MARSPSLILKQIKDHGVVMKALNQRVAKVESIANKLHKRTGSLNSKKGYFDQRSATALGTIYGTLAEEMDQLSQQMYYFTNLMQVPTVGAARP
jgi:hypothetical protein